MGEDLLDGERNKRHEGPSPAARLTKDNEFASLEPRKTYLRKFATKWSALFDKSWGL